MDDRENSSHAEIENAQEIWGDVTSPSQHDDKNFRYLVHAFNPSAKLAMSMAANSLRLRQENGANAGNQAIDLFSQPQRLHERVALACSLIDQDHRGTWGDAGLIINTPIKNVVRTKSKDAGSLVMNRELLLQQAADQPLLEPDALLKQSSRNFYNEVDVLATNDGAEVSLKGFFYKTMEDGSPMSEGLYEVVSAHAKRLGLPLVAIPDLNVIENEKIDQKNETLAVSLNNRRYVLRQREKFVFEAYKQNHSSTFPSPEEIENVFLFLDRNGWSNDDISKLREGYQETDAIRHRTNTEFDSEGAVVSISKKIGYGDAEEIIDITSNGAFKYNIADEKKNYLVKQGLPYKQLPSVIVRLTSDDVESVVAEAVKLDVVNAERISKWWEQVRTKKSEKASSVIRRSVVVSPRLESQMEALLQQLSEKK